MATAKIVIKIRDKFFLQQNTYNPINVVPGSSFFLQSNMDRVYGSIPLGITGLYPAIDKVNSVTVFNGLISVLNGIALQSLFSVTDSTKVVDLMQIANKRTSTIGENLLNYYFILVDTANLVQIINDLNKLKITLNSGIENFYIRGELSNSESSPIGSIPAEMPTEFVPIMEKGEFIQNNSKINSFLPEQKAIKQPSLEINIPNSGSFLGKTPTSPLPTSKSTIAKINTLFGRSGIDLNADLSDINVIDTEQAWTNTTLSSLNAPQSILGGAFNNNYFNNSGITNSPNANELHGNKTYNVLFKSPTSGFLNGLCQYAGKYVASTWYRVQNTASTWASIERREAALVDTCISPILNVNINNFQPINNQSKIILLELQIDVPKSMMSPHLGSYNNLPVEIESAMFATIQTAVNAGFVIIEAAGNGGHRFENLFLSNNSGITNPLLQNPTKDLTQSNSGAIMVGASTFSSSKFNMILNRGNRVDCYGFGDVVNTSVGRTFNYTSLASAVVTAMVAHLQFNAKKSLANRFMTITEIKAILRIVFPFQLNTPFDKTPNLNVNIPNSTYTSLSTTPLLP